MSQTILQLPDLCMSDNAPLVLSVGACLIVVGVIAWARRRKPESDLPLPPSPPTWRLGGHFLPRHHSSLTIAGWIDEYGPLITIRSKFERIIIIGRYKAAVDIMENQGKLTADRPRMIAAGEVFGGGMGIGFAYWGDRFRRMRRALHTHLQPKAAAAYQPLQMSHAKDTVLGILDDPHGDFQKHVITYAATTIMKIAYGKTTSTSATDSSVVEIRHFVKTISAVARLKTGVREDQETQPWSAKLREGPNAERHGHRPFIREIYSRKSPSLWFVRHRDGLSWWFFFCSWIRDDLYGNLYSTYGSCMFP